MKKSNLALYEIKILLTKNLCKMRNFQFKFKNLHMSKKFTLNKSKLPTLKLRNNLLKLKKLLIKQVNKLN